MAQLGIDARSRSFARFRCCSKLSRKAAYGSDLPGMSVAIIAIGCKPSTLRRRPIDCAFQACRLLDFQIFIELAVRMCCACVSVLT